MKRLHVLFLALVLCFCCTATALAQPSLDAKAAMLVDLDSDTVLYSLNEDAQVYPASLTKIMTGLLFAEWAEENDAWETKISVSAEAVAGIDPAGSTAWLQAGEEIPAKDLLACILIISANDACNVAAEAVSGDIASFVEAMNARAAELGCTGTHFANTHGLHDENHYTTVHDLRLITTAAIANEDVWSLCCTGDATIPATNLSNERELHSSNYMISTYTGYTYYDERIEGGKTGFTTPAGRCLIVTARQDGHHLLSIVCGAPDTVVISGNTRYGHFIETTTLLDYGFENFDALLTNAPIETDPEPETPDAQPEENSDASDETPASDPAETLTDTETEENATQSPQSDGPGYLTLAKYVLLALGAFLVLWIAFYIFLTIRKRKRK